MSENVTAYAPYDSEGKRMPLACPVEYLYDENGYGAGERRFASAEQGAKADALAAGAAYRTEEVKTGETWIDGRPIYRKILKTAVPGNGVFWYALGSSIDMCVKIEGIICDTVNNSVSPLPIINPWLNISDTIRLGANTDRATSNKNSILIASAGDEFKGQPIYLTVYYTRPTDAPEVTSNG